MILNRNTYNTQLLIAFAIMLTTLVNCKNKPGSINSVKNKELMISKDHAIEIANRDAVMHYNDLSIYTIHVELIDDNWKIDYEFKDKKLDGGGPHYIISGQSGKILESHFYQ